MIKEKHVPLRMCMACRQMKPKETLIRLVKSGNEIIVDEKMNIQQRGAYLCKNRECAALLKKKHGIERHMKCEAENAYALLDDYLTRSGL